MPRSDLNLPSEAFRFGMDEYLKVQFLLGECLLKQGWYSRACTKLEGVKAKIAAELVFDKPYLQINTFSLLGNSYLKLKESDKAKENFEAALNLINTLNRTPEQVSPKV
jgi:tetratricopeptide (TPR) repeat protein